MPRAVRSRVARDADPRVLRALADGTRRRILRRLGAGEMRAGDVAAGLPVARPTVSRHLGVLRAAGLVVVRREGRERWYALAPGPLRAAVARVSAFDATLAAGLEKLGAHLARGGR